MGCHSSGTKTRRGHEGPQAHALTPTWTGGDVYTTKNIEKQNNKTVCRLCDNQLCWPRTDMGISTRVLMQQQEDNQS